MKTLTSVALTVAACVGATLVAYFVMKQMELELGAMMFVVGALVGSQVAAWRMYVDGKGETQIPISTMLSAGMMLAASNAVVGIALTYSVDPFLYPDITIGISTVGSIFFPFATTNTVVRAFSQREKVKSDTPKNE